MHLLVNEEHLYQDSGCNDKDYCNVQVWLSQDGKYIISLESLNWKQYDHYFDDGKNYASQSEQERQSKYNVTLRRLRVTNVVLEKQLISHVLRVCVCRLRYPSWNGHGLYFHQWAARLYHIFPHYLIKDTIFETTLPNIKCVVWFSVQGLSEIFLILSGNERDMIKDVYLSSCKVTVILVRF